MVRRSITSRSPISCTSRRTSSSLRVCRLSLRRTRPGTVMPPSVVGRPPRSRVLVVPSSRTQRPVRVEVTRATVLTCGRRAGEAAGRRRRPVGAARPRGRHLASGDVQDAVSSGTHVIAEGQEALPELRPALGEPALRGDVGRLALRGLDRDRLVAVLAEVVGRGPHVELADLHGQLEAVRHQLAGRGRAQLVGPLVEVHPRVQAARLLQLGLGLPGRLQAVAADGGRREEPEGVEVGAADRVRLDDRVGARLAEAERDRVPGAGRRGRPSPTRAGRSIR